MLVLFKFLLFGNYGNALLLISVPMFLADDAPVFIFFWLLTWSWFTHLHYSCRLRSSRLCGLSCRRRRRLAG